MNNDAKIQDLKGRIEHCERMSKLYLREWDHNKELYSYHVRAAETHYNNKESMEFNIKEMCFKIEDLQKDLKKLEQEDVV